MTYDTEFVCDIVTQLTHALDSDNRLTAREKRGVAMAIVALDPIAGREYLRKYAPGVKMPVK